MQMALQVGPLAPSDFYASEFLSLTDCRLQNSPLGSEDYGRDEGRSQCLDEDGSTICDCEVVVRHTPGVPCLRALYIAGECIELL